MKLYFWQKKKPSLEDNIKLLLPLIVEAAPRVAKMIRDSRRNDDIEAGLLPDDMPTPGALVGKLYDFFNNLGRTHGVFEDDGPNPSSISTGWMDGIAGVTRAGVITQGGHVIPRIDGMLSTARKDEKILRIDVTPKSVLHELETTLPIKGFNLEKLQIIIDTLNDKERFCNQHYGKEQIKGLIKRLENRKKYGNHYGFYRQFPNTTDSRIDGLLQKYKLVIKTSDLFIPTFPKEAIDVMKEYARITKEMCGEDPVFYVIAQEKDFKKKHEKLDPILLVQSPFGFYWQILGAWDEEMLLLSEL